MEKKVHRLMDRMQARHAQMRKTWYGPVLSPVLVVAGFALLIFGIIILPTPAPGWLCIFVALGILSLVHPPTRHFNIWLAAKLDAFYEWYGKRHIATKATLFVLLLAFMATCMGSAYYFIAPEDWPYTDASG
ncbi:MAG: TIGR02611 family protein [Corynebacterium sp.]|uniref:TIGR02611 family protein n=1 Tax=Corynebacterium sp. TaxID=1720 RepID=UPI0026DD1C9C|nr:TIGR02611 family protein [Corynebacterium sp.]MDO5029391.1 TIGR02611 family protein [Corynebacterium sp.]